MSTRRELLRHLFRLLEERQIPFCVLRNYDRLYDDSPSDIDLLTLPGRAAEVIECCQLAAKATRHALVQRTRFVNHSLVYWNGDLGFVRVDIDTEKRWQRFHLLTAATILASRRKYEGFYVPDPLHECVILLTQVLWQGKLSERYAARLRQLSEEIPPGSSPGAAFGAAFGLKQNLLEQLDDPSLPARLKRAVRRSACMQPARALYSFTYLFKDAQRLRSRRESTPGLFLRLVGANATLAAELAARLNVLFPLKKTVFRVGSVAAKTRHQAMFKGGLVIESLPAVPKPASLLRHDWPEMDRSFAAVSEPDGDMHLIHVGSGVMQLGKDADSLVRFICTTLIRLHTPDEKHAGVFAVLVGLDGAGKTTLARNIARLAANEKSFVGVRYFHWLPALGAAVEFPLPEPGNQPRKPRLDPGWLAAVQSAGRLTRNLLRAWLAWWFRLRSLRKRGYLVLVDRYFYNYHLDPVSVKYYGPRWWLDTLSDLFPKPDIVITLSAPAEVLLQRKQELAEAEIHEQAANLRRLKFPTTRVIAADAGEPANTVAQKVITSIAGIQA